jgi:16S rRNA (cytosine967-C5)-methyltransferase
MPISPARAVIFEILLQVEQKGGYASELLHASHASRLSPADHNLATEIVLGVLRWRSWLDGKISAHSSQKIPKLDAEVLAALRMGVYQLLFLDRIPAWAAIHESVELVKQSRKRSAAGFANAVLRKIADQPGSKAGASTETKPPLSAEVLAQQYAHPRWLVERWVRELGLERAAKICAGDQQIPATTVRLQKAEVEAELRQEGIELAPGRLLTSARVVLEGDITKTKAFREGRVAVQDEGSQLVTLLVGKGTNILDCCAAPGGKTRILAEQNPGAKITAVELHAHRARLLRKLVPAKNVEVEVGDVRKLKGEARFDRVLADVPCTGTGTLARNPEIKWRLQAEDLVDLPARQLEILRAAMKQVAPGGRLVYSTCSLEHEENEAVVEKALGTGFRLRDCRAELERLGDELAWKDLDSLVKGRYLRTTPGVHPCDGFFAAVLERV